MVRRTKENGERITKVTNDFSNGVKLTLKRWIAILVFIFVGVMATTMVAAVHASPTVLALLVSTEEETLFTETNGPISTDTFISIPATTSTTTLASTTTTTSVTTTTAITTTTATTTEIETSTTKATKETTIEEESYYDEVAPVEKNYDVHLYNAPATITEAVTHNEESVPVPEEDVVTSTTAEIIATTQTAVVNSVVEETSVESETAWMHDIQEDDADFILICNCVAYEAGADYISTADKAKVAEVIMNRVDSSLYPDTVYGVITQKNQFSGHTRYSSLNTYCSKVTDSVKEAVRGYLRGDYENHGYTGFYGDGYRNYFR